MFLISRVGTALAIAAVMVWGGTAGAIEFDVEIAGLSVGGIHKIDGVNSVAVDDIIFDYQEASAADIREMTTGTDVEYRRMALASLKNGDRMYMPGRPTFGNITFEMDRQYGGTKEFHDWFESASSGKVDRRSISVIFHNDAGEEAGRMNFYNCWPSAYKPPALNGAVAGFDEYAVGIESMSLDAVDNAAAVKNPKLLVGMQDSNGVLTQSILSGGWEGGEPELIQTWPFLDAKFHTSSPGHKTVGEITLRGAMTDGRQNLCQWINDTVNGKPWKRMLSITELLRAGRPAQQGKVVIYYDCFPTRVTFPVFSTASKDNSGPSLNIKASRININ